MPRPSRSTTILLSILVVSGTVVAAAGLDVGRGVTAVELPGDLVARGEFVTARLESAPAERQGPQGMPLDLFAGSSDSLFWTGPTRPNPYSWLRPAVVCKDTLDFRVEVTDQNGRAIDVLEFSRIPPAAYWFVLGDSNASLESLAAVRFVYDDTLILESRLARK